LYSNGGGRAIFRNVVEFYQPTWCNVPEDIHLYSHHRKNLRSHRIVHCGKATVFPAKSFTLKTKATCSFETSVNVRLHSVTLEDSNLHRHRRELIFWCFYGHALSVFLSYDNKSVQQPELNRQFRHLVPEKGHTEQDSVLLLSCLKLLSVGMHNYLEIRKTTLSTANLPQSRCEAFFASRSIAFNLAY
jgi:hypothetical protein